MSTTKWALDPTHSEIQFKVKHLMITTVTGSFKKFNAEAESTADNFDGAHFTFTADMNSIDTNNEQRDGHLKSGDFFDVEKFGEMKFTSTNFDKKDDGNYKLAGNLTIKDATHPIALDVEFAGMEKDPWGNQKAGFTINGKINRNTFGLTWNAALESGGMLVSEDVRILGEIQLVKQA
ncbi:MAG: YceI family protein [Bacteroidetes bacterium]|nr:YceI family protein [Bacteroidota bacterium]